ncbi:MAG: zinc ABC transporter ATP-binding protein [Candidatus Gerdarchaeota archaeon]|nr:MAG: zinc ABC transporter ATP-binding protein [Candidatus Gerdarchaeota archaeon]RLI72966.1 MAG: zinc ABC transporter ATP-binding protein [Candidatus Gerdarchaeota archaeon]
MAKKEQTTSQKVYDRDEQSPDDDLLICINGLAVAYQTNVALFDINLDVHQHDFIGICGPNGSGKSTLLKSIVGAIKPVQGSLRVFGKDLTKSNIRGIKAKIGYVPQIQNIERNFPALVEDVVGMGLYSQIGFFRALSKKHREKITAALKLVGMDAMAKRPIGHLSGGQQQKIKIARALVNNPEILLIDEPFTALDFKVAKNIADVIANIYQETSVTIVMVSHSIPLIKELCNRAVCLDKRLIWQGDPHSPEFENAMKLVFH